MYNPAKIRTLLHQATTGEIAAHGNLEDADGVVAFPFGLRIDENEKRTPGTTNIAIADFIANHDVLSQKPITLTEELERAWPGEHPHVLRVVTNFPGGGNEASTTHDYARRVREVLPRSVGTLAVVAFRFHLPRAEAAIKRAGFSTVIPDMSQVGDFDPESAQPQTTNAEQWAKRERIVLRVSAFLNYI